jgi:peroxiredoxin
LPIRSFRACGAALLVCIIGSTACSSSPDSKVRAAVKAEKDRRVAPDFVLKDADGKTVKLSDYKGKVVLLNFWATWCGPCKIEIPWFIDFEQRFKDRGFAVLGVSMDEDGWEIVKPYIEKHRVNYRNLLGNDSVAVQFGGVDSLPTTFLIDSTGRIASTHVGLVSKSNYENEIVHLLSQRGSSGTAPASSD